MKIEKSIIFSTIAISIIVFFTACESSSDISTTPAATGTTLKTTTDCQNVNPSNGKCEDIRAMHTVTKATANRDEDEPKLGSETTSDCQNVNPINGSCDDAAETTAYSGSAPTKTLSNSPTTIDEIPNDTQEPVTQTSGECQTINPITRFCED